MSKLKVKVFIIVISLVLLSCSANPLQPLTDLDRKSLLYPGFTPFLTSLNNESLSIDFPSQEREVVLKTLSLVKFTVNTDEFREAFLQEELFATDNKDSFTTDLSMRIGQPLDEERVLDQFLEFENFHTKVSKASLPRGVAGLGTVPEPNVYLENFDDPFFPIIKDFMDSVNFVRFYDVIALVDALEIYGNLGEILIHEMTHNMGYSHVNDPITGAFIIPIENDTAYTFGRVFREVFLNPDFQDKYSQDIASFLPYYEVIHSNFIIALTQVSEKLRNAKNTTDKNEPNIPNLSVETVSCDFYLHLPQTLQ